MKTLASILVLAAGLGLGRIAYLARCLTPTLSA